MPKKVKRIPTRGIVLVRNVDLDTYKEFKALAEAKDKKLGPYLSEAMREKLAREKE